MPYLVFLPGLLCAVALQFWSTRKVFLDVCLPVLLFCPVYFQLRAPHLPGVDVGESVMIPLGLSLLFRHVHQYRFSRADLWLSLYIASGVVPYFRTGDPGLGRFVLFLLMVNAGIPYLAGKLLAEQGDAHLSVVRRMVQILFFVAVFSLPEYPLRLNLFSRAGMHVFPGQWPGWISQIRWGGARVAGPYGTSEIAGTIFFVALILIFWLWDWIPDDSVFRHIPRLKWKNGTVIMFLCLLLTLVLTQSRGPWCGFVVACAFSYIGRARNIRRRALVVLPLLAIGMYFGYGVLQRYAAARTGAQGDEAQSSVSYRQQLIPNYLPIAELGGPWGWGLMFPTVRGQTSIDIEFLGFWLAQGYVGLSAFVLLIGEGVLAFAQTGLRAGSREKRHLSFSLLGILLGWAFTFTTVYMGMQSFNLFFFIIGWSQALVAKRPRAPVFDVQAQATIAPVPIRVYS